MIWIYVTGTGVHLYTCAAATCAQLRLGLFARPCSYMRSSICSLVRVMGTCPGQVLKDESMSLTTPGPEGADGGMSGLPENWLANCASRLLLQVVAPQLLSLPCLGGG